MKAKRRSAGAEGRYLNWLLAILVIAILLALLVPGVSAGWYRRNVTIDNTGGGILTEYQVLVNITDHDHMEYGGNSIRFTDTGNSIKYDYWIEEWNDGGTSRIWVEVPSVPAYATSEMYMWYGDSGAIRESNGAATFTFFDDFDNLNNWKEELFYSKPTHNHSVISAVNSKLVVETTDSPNREGACTEAVQLSQGKKFEAKVVSRTSKNLLQVIYNSQNHLYENGPYANGEYGVWRKDGTGDGIRVYDPGPGTGIDAPCYPYVEYRTAGNKVHFGTRRGGEVYKESSYWPDFKLGFYSYFSGTIEIDWVFVRKYASTEPGTTVSGDEVNGGGGAPVPELPTILLFSVGLLVLAGYVLLRRREKEKGE